MADQTLLGWPFFEAAHRDYAAVQLQGGDGLHRGTIVETLHHEIRALRIFEGASDVQKVVIACAGQGD
jgi:acyl-CoA dehydrogenase